MENKHEGFFEEMNNRTLKEEFYSAIKKELDEFDDVDTRALIKRMGFLTDNERYKYRYLLTVENLTNEEIDRYEHIYPERTGGGLFHKYFPKEEDVDDHYKTNFTAGRTMGG